MTSLARTVLSLACTVTKPSDLQPRGSKCPPQLVLTDGLVDGGGRVVRSEKRILIGNISKTTQYFCRLFLVPTEGFYRHLFKHFELEKDFAIKFGTLFFEKKY